MNRKRHSLEAGYIAERRNHLIPGLVAVKVTIYVAAEQGIDVAGSRYAVVCDAHGTLCGATSMPKARQLMKQPEAFCLQCRELTD